jgi:hypothetical protein
MREIIIQVDDELLNFIDRHANGDRNTYLSKLLKRDRRWAIQQEMIHALQEDVSNPDYLAEISLWDSLAGDGLDAGR